MRYSASIPVRRRGKWKVRCPNLDGRSYRKGQSAAAPLPLHSLPPNIKATVSTLSLGLSSTLFLPSA